MKNYFFLQLSFLLLAWNLSAKESIGHSQTTIVCGKIINQTNESPKVITIQTCNPLSDEERFASRIDSTGEFRAAFEMLWGHSFTISYDHQCVNLYADVSDSIYLEIDATKFHERKKEALVFSGNNSQKNNEFSQTMNDLSGIVIPTFKDFKIPLEDFIKILETDNNRINDSIAHYCHERNISQWTQRLVQKMSLYSLANYAIDYKGRNTQEALEFYDQPIFDIFNPNNFSNMMFSYHVDAFRIRMIRNDSLMTIYSKNRDVIGFEKRGCDLLYALPKSLCRDVMLYSFYKKIEGGTFEIDKNGFTNELIYAKVLDLRKIKMSIELPKINSGKGAFFWSPNGKIENIKNFSLEKLIKEKYSGKVIYMDIWATWCGPCRTEMTPAREIHKLYHDKDVVFVNICMKSTQEAWAKMIGNGEVEGDNYFFDDDLSSEASASLLSSGYPTYIFIGRDGKIRTKQAPRPASVSLVCEDIDKLLSE